MSRPLAVIAPPLMVVGFVVGLLVFEQSWSLAATLLVAYGIIAFLTLVAVILVLVVFPDFGSKPRAPAATRIH